MKDYIKEFGDDQEDKKLQVQFEPESEWGFEPEIKPGKVPIQEPPSDEDQTSFATEKADIQKTLAHLQEKKQNHPELWTEGDERALDWKNKELESVNEKLKEGKIFVSELKDVVSEAILKAMNQTGAPPMKADLNESQKKEIKEKVRLCEARSGFMSITFHDDFNKDECILGARIDPTNNNDWILTREEVVHTLPYSYKDALYEFVKSIR